MAKLKNVKGKCVHTGTGGWMLSGDGVYVKDSCELPSYFGEG